MGHNEMRPSRPKRSKHNPYFFSFGHHNIDGQDGYIDERYFYEEIRRASRARFGRTHIK